MTRLARVGRWLWGLAATAAILLSTMSVSAICVVLLLVTRRPWPPDVLGPIWSRAVLKICGIRVEVEGLEHVDRNTPYVLISNHLSYFDIWVAMAALPLTIRFVAKKELLRVPVFGQGLALSDHIVIDRSNPQEAIARINARVARQIDQGLCILFYAEGTRSADGTVQPFKKGGVALALATGLPIIPMSISGTRKFLPKGHVVVRPGGRVKLVLAPPIDTKGYSPERRDELNDAVRRIVIDNYVADY